MKCLCRFLLIFLTLKTISFSSGDRDEESGGEDSDDGVVETSLPYRYIGCFKDNQSRAMVDYLGKWYNNNTIIANCAIESWKRGYEVFGLQDYDECWSSKNATLTYDMYGTSNKCHDNGTGGKWANTVYSFRSCPPGCINSNINSFGNWCQVCPVDTYKENNVSCKKCSKEAQTWGRRGVASIGDCSAENPIKVSSYRVHIPPGSNHGIITTFKASYKNDSLVIPPLVYIITSITKLKDHARNENVHSGYFKSCSEHNDVSRHPAFCIYKHNGSIFLTKDNFDCTEGEIFVIKINVSDSANISSGIISNSNGTVTLICNDTCKGSRIRSLYERALDACMQTKYTVLNNGSPQMEVTSSNIYAIYRIDLTISKEFELSKKLKTFSCNILIESNTSQGRFVSNITIRNNVVKKNQTVIPVVLQRNAIVLKRPLAAFNISLQCSNVELNLCSITKVTFTILPRKLEDCTVNETCLRSVAVWNNSVKEGLSDCHKDSLGIWSRYGRCIGKPKISFGPEVLRVTSGSGPVRFYCNVTSPGRVEITWLRENFNSKRIVGRGPILSLTAQPYNQSYYWCNATNVFGTRTRRALLVTKDYFTSIVHVQFKLRKGKSNRKDFSCKVSCRNILKDETKYLLGPCIHRKLKGQITVECTFYGKRNLDTNSYYQKLAADLRKDDVQTNIVVVKDAENCLGESTGQKNIQGIFKWQSTTIGQSDTSDCPLGPQDETNGIRKCSGNFLRGGTWGEPQVAACNFKSQNTETLNKLKETKVDNKNAKEVAQNLAKVFKKSSPKDFTGADCSLAADVVSNIVSIGDQLNETAGLVLEVIGNIMEMNETTLAESQGATNKIIDALDKVAENIPIDDGKTSKVLTTGNLVLQANKVSKSSFQGIEFGVKDDGSVATSTTDQSVISVQLPSSILARTSQASSRIGFVHYGNNKLFQSQLKGNETKLSKHVISSSVYNTTTSNLSQPVRLRIPRLKGQDGKSLGNSSCVYWDEAGRKWLRDGCTLCRDQDSDADSVQCCCSHLTSFAVLFSPRPIVPTPGSKHTKILSIITYVGCAISLLGVVLTFLTYSMFRHLRKSNQQPIIMNLCVAIALLLIVFVSGIHITDNRMACQVIAVLLHYLTLVTVLWMGIEAYNLYLQIVKVMAIYKRKFMLKAALVGWGVPLLVVMATLAAAIIQYKQQNGKITFYYGNEQMCILHNHLYRLVGWFAPVLAILVINLVIFFVVVRKLHSTGTMSPIETKSAQRKRCWTAFAIMFLLGLTWLFGALAVSDAKLIFEYLFCIFNSLQGFFIFFFHCVRIKEVRRQWSFFVSGLGFSHKDSQQSHPRSRGIGESQHSSQYPQRVRVKSWTPMDSDVPRKETMLTTIEDKNGIGVTSDDDLKMIDVQLEIVRLNNHSNHSTNNLTTFGKGKPC